jgi:hypothetical protein
MSARYLTLVVAIVGLTACNADRVASPSPVLTLEPCAAAGGIVQLSVLQGATISCTAGGTIDLAGDGAHYLVVPQFATGDVSNTSIAYTIGVPSAGVTASVAAAYDAEVSVAAPPALPPQAAFDFSLRAAERSATASGRWVSETKTTTPPLSARIMSDSPAVGSLRDFRVISSIDVDNPTFKTVTARLSFAGQNMLIYIDTLAPPNGFSPDQLTAFGQLFDQTLYPIDIDAFGAPSDVDQTGTVIMLLSPVVNSLTPKAQCSTQGFVAGFFDGYDLVSTSANSNKGEIFYGVVPDPTGSVSCAHSVVDLDRTVPPTFLHELQHLISFSQHVVVHHGQEEEGWLDEGMSIVAEELGSVYYEQRFPPPTGRTNASQVFPDSSQGFISGLLGDSYTYLLRTDTATATLHSDSDGGLAWRGSDWLLLRWLGDQKGAGFYRQLEQGSSIGVANIEAASGESFQSLFGDFSTSLWTDSIVAVPKSSIPPRNRFSTRTLRVLYQALYNAAGPSAQIPRAYPVQLTTLPIGSTLNGTMVPGTMAFYRLDAGAGSGTVRLQFSTPSSGSFAGNLHSQVSIFRLPN